MPLTSGTRLGPYQIEAAVGAGGMGEVYRARDTRLERIVAIKVLPPQFAGDPQFRERFEREAKSISALNHPNICTLYDVGESPGSGPQTPAIHFLVMEYLEGETLADRLGKGALPLPDALRIATEIAGALEKAHRQGIVHRDLKPGNVMLTKGGAKLLDFGLSKAGPISPLSGAAATALPTMAAPLTTEGTILGTFQYMAPEQIEGDQADARTDIFAFGAVLYEMLTGRKAFQGKSQASLLGAILKDEPPAVRQVQPIVPPALDHLVRSCLAKDPDARFQTAHDVLLQLRWIVEGGSAAGVPAPVVARRRSRERIAWATAAVLGAIAIGAGVLGVLHLGETPVPADPVRFTIAPADNSTLAAPAMVAVSSDGRQVVFVASAPQGLPMLWVRPFATLEARALPGTERSAHPFWSPDGRYVGFFAGGKLNKVDVSGGAPMVLCDAPIGFGGTWNRNNVIVFSPSGLSPLHKVDAAGGMSTPVTTLGEGETSHRYPSFLPDSDHVIYLARTALQLRVASLGSTETTSLGAAESNGVYASGHLLFSRGGTLMAQPFDPATRRVRGDPFPVAEQVPSSGAGRAPFSVSATGVLSYVRGTALVMSRLTWMDRAGKTLGVVGEAGPYRNLSLSPDERRVAVSTTTGSPANRDIWVIDLARADTASRLTLDPAIEADPIWSPDGAQILFNSNRDGGLFNSAFLRSSDLGGQDVPLAKMERLIDSPDWSHDGRFLVFTGGGSQTSNDLWVLPFSGDRKPTPFLQAPSNEDSPAFSPNDRWIAYNSDVSGRFEVYVRSFATPGGQPQISRNGGWAPRWRGDGKEIFFLALDGTMMAADVTLGNEVQAGVPHALFPTTLLKTADRHTYAVTNDGKRFLLPVRARQLQAPITIVLNWPAMLKQ